MRIFLKIVFNFFLFLPGEDEDRLEGARDEEHPHGQLPDEHVVGEIGDVLGATLYVLERMQSLVVVVTLVG